MSQVSLVIHDTENNWNSNRLNPPLYRLSCHFHWPTHTQTRPHHRRRRFIENQPNWTKKKIYNQEKRNYGAMIRIEISNSFEMRKCMNHIHAYTINSEWWRISSAAWLSFSLRAVIMCGIMGIDSFSLSLSPSLFLSRSLALFFSLSIPAKEKKRRLLSSGRETTQKIAFLPKELHQVLIMHTLKDQ